MRLTGVLVRENITWLALDSALRSIFDFSSNSFVFMIFGPVLVTVEFRKLRLIISFNYICIDKSFRKCADQLIYIGRASCNFAEFNFIFVENASSGVVAFAS